MFYSCLPLAFCQVATEADLGLADAYINGYFSFADQREGLLNLFLVKLCSVPFDDVHLQIHTTVSHFYCITELMNHFHADSHC